MKPLFRLALFTGLLLGSAAVYAATDTPVGTWKTIDDATGKPKSIVEITEQNGELQGKVLKVLQSDEGPNPICRKCDGERKDQPVEGMVIMWGVTRDGDEWDGGKILDPHNGKEYSADAAKDAVTAAAKNKSQPVELLVKNFDEYQTLKVPYHDGLKYPHLERVKGEPDHLSELLKAR